MLTWSPGKLASAFADAKLFKGSDIATVFDVELAAGELPDAPLAQCPQTMKEFTDKFIAPMHRSMHDEHVRFLFVFFYLPSALSSHPSPLPCTFHYSPSVYPCRPSSSSCSSSRWLTR